VPPILFDLPFGVPRWVGIIIVLVVVLSGWFVSDRRWLPVAVVVGLSLGLWSAINGDWLGAAVMVTSTGALVSAHWRAARRRRLPPRP
jgi:hypothetical protein